MLHLLLHSFFLLHVKWLKCDNVNLSTSWHCVNCIKATNDVLYAHCQGANLLLRQLFRARRVEPNILKNVISPAVNVSGRVAGHVTPQLSCWLLLFVGIFSLRFLLATYPTFNSISFGYLVFYCMLYCGQILLLICKVLVLFYVLHLFLYLNF